MDSGSSSQYPQSVEAQILELRNAVAAQEREIKLLRQELSERVTLDKKSLSAEDHKDELTVKEEVNTLRQQVPDLEGQKDKSPTKKVVNSVPKKLDSIELLIIDLQIKIAALTSQQKSTEEGKSAPSGTAASSATGSSASEARLPRGYVEVVVENIVHTFSFEILPPESRIYKSFTPGSTIFPKDSKGRILLPYQSEKFAELIKKFKDKTLESDSNASSNQRQYY